MHRVELKVRGQRLCHPQEFPFLMHRVELKACEHEGNYFSPCPFLMHRVELKAFTWKIQSLFWRDRVPNAPCGVERGFRLAFPQETQEFPMHRVELKVFFYFFLY